MIYAEISIINAIPEKEKKKIIKIKISITNYMKCFNVLSTIAIYIDLDKQNKTDNNTYSFLFICPGKRKNMKASNLINKNIEKRSSPLWWFSIFCFMTPTPFWDKIRN